MEGKISSLTQAQWDLTIEERIESAEIKKGLGNVLYTDGKILDAMENYSNAVKLLIPVYQPPENLADDVKHLKTSLYLNLSACQLKFGQYDFAVKNCTKVLVVQQDNIKALYRRTVAFTELNRFEEAYSDVMTGLKIDKGNTALKKQLLILRNKMVKQGEKDSTVMKSYLGEISARTECNITD